MEVRIRLIALAKRKFVIIIALLLVFTSSLFIPASSAQAAEIKDMNQCSDYAKPYIARLVQSGIICGDANGYFNPHQTVTRAQMITLIVKALELDKSIVPENTDSFADVPAGHWANKFVEIAYQAGITQGTAPGQFGVNQPCTREQMITMFVNCFNVLDTELDIPEEIMDLSQFTDESQISAWARDSVAFGVYMGLVNGTSATTISPRVSAPREQVAVLTDIFITRKNNVIADMQAQGLLEQAWWSMTEDQGLSHTSNIDIAINLEQTSPDFPAQMHFSFQALNEMIWPAVLHQTIKMEANGLPDDIMPPLDIELFLMDGVLYQRGADESQTGWIRSSQGEEEEIQEFMDMVTEAAETQLLIPDGLHKTVKCTLEKAEVNGTDGHKITYEGQINDIALLLDQILPSLMPGSDGSVDFQEELDAIATLVKSISFKEVYYIGADGRFYGSEFNISLNCNSAASPDFPVKNIVISGQSNNFKYNGINIVLPQEAKNAPVIE